MARAFDAELMDYARARALSGAVGRALEKIAGRNAMLAFASWTQRKNYRVIFSDGEQVGILLAALLKFFGRGNERHLMIVHILSVGKKMLFFLALGVQSHIDIFFCYSTWQKKIHRRKFARAQPARHLDAVYGGFKIFRARSNLNS